MVKELVKHGNSLAVVIERPILDLIGASADTHFDVVTDGKSLVLTPVENPQRSEKFKESVEKIGKKYSKAFEELAK